MTPQNPDSPSRPPTMPRAHSRRSRILDYLARQGGELRSDSGMGLRRQIADALGERPTAVGQTLVALEKAGLLHRELDVQHHRCFAIRLSPDVRPALPLPEIDLQEPALPAEPAPDHRRVAADLDAARQELKDAILRASQVSRRVRDLEWALWRSEHRQTVST